MLGVMLGVRLSAWLGQVRLGLNLGMESMTVDTNRAQDFCDTVQAT